MIIAGSEISRISSRSTESSWWLKSKRDGLTWIGTSTAGSRISRLVTSPGRISRANNA
ncbi:Uncharacterised protein [Acinetobacter baumannii]|nr:Uncharacterised protein [Acinetobacter baumannii]